MKIDISELKALVTFVLKNISVLIPAV
jgi:hypothetical protein